MGKTILKVKGRLSFEIKDGMFIIEGEDVDRNGYDFKVEYPFDAFEKVMNEMGFALVYMDGR